MKDDLLEFVGVFLTCIVVILICSLLSSCFITGRQLTFSTPKVEITADTATAYTFPYNTKFQ